MKILSRPKNVKKVKFRKGFIQAAYSLFIAAFVQNVFFFQSLLKLK